LRNQQLHVRTDILEEAVGPLLQRFGTPRRLLREGDFNEGNGGVARKSNEAPLSGPLCTIVFYSHGRLGTTVISPWPS
jgi:hypothetical protein